jgi:hypothetical protein
MRRLRVTLVVLIASVIAVALQFTPRLAAQQRGAAPPGAGQLTPPTGTGLIVGQVVDAATSQPIAGAIVVTNVRANAAGRRGGGPGAAGPPIQPIRLVTGADGRFVLRDLPKMSVAITAAANGYVNGGAGQSRPGGAAENIDVGDGEKIADVRILLWKTAVITGTVTDDSGEPVVGAQVRASRRVAVAGRTRYNYGASATTDDRGAFRLSGLPPGDYVVVVPETQQTVPTAMLDAALQSVSSGTPAGAAMMDLFTSGAMVFNEGAGNSPLTGVRVDDLMFSTTSGGATVTADGRILTNPTVYYASASSLGQATVITVKSGEVRSGIDLPLHLVPTARISGLLTAAGAPVGGVAVRLMPNLPDNGFAGDEVQVAATSTRPDGTFTFLGVPPGQYFVDAVRRPRPQIPPELASNPMVQMAFGGGGGGSEALYGATTVSTDGRDVSDLAVVLTGGVTISGRFVFDGTATRPAPQQMQNLAISLQSIDGRTNGQMAFGGSGPRVPVDANGAFKTIPYPAGKYLVTAPAAGSAWIVQSMLVGGHDLVREPLELKGEDITDLVVTYTDKVGQVAGTVRAPAGSTLKPATVFLFPADYPDRIALADARLFRNAPASKDGSYTFGGLPAGDYYVAAMTADDAPDNRDAEFFTALSRGATHVTLTDGERKTLDLQIVRVTK